MKYKIGSKVIIKKLRRQGVVKKMNDYSQFPYKVKLLDGNMDWYSNLELKPLPEKKEKYCYCVCHCDHEGGCIRGQKECYHCKKVEKPKEECKCELCPKYCLKECYQCHPTPPPVKSSEIEKLDLFPSLQNLEDSFNSIENKINELVDRLNKL